MERDLLTLNISGSEDDGRSTPSERALAAGLAAGAFALVVTAIPRFILGTPFIPERVLELLFAVAPIALIEPVVTILGPYAKRFAFLFAIMGTLGIFGWIGWAYSRKRPSASVGDGALLGIGLWLVASVTLVPALGGGLFGVGWRPNAWLAAGSLLLLGLAFGLGFTWVLARLERDERLARRAAGFVSRRAVLQSILGAGVIAIAYESVVSLVDWIGVGNESRVRNGTGVFPEIDGLAREITPTDDFYVVSKNVFDPDLPMEGWSLEVGGLVDRPRAYSLEELRAIAPSEAYATLMCISNLVGGDLLGNALWKGVPLAALLEAAGLQAGAVDVVFTAFDDYTDSISIERAIQPGTLLAYEIDGKALPREHGAPLRAIVPGIYGMKNVKWIKRIEVVARDYKGYWQRRGWDDVAEYQTMSRIDVARSNGAGRPADIAGIAFAGDRGIGRVEVSIDGGQQWIEAGVRAPLSQNSWVLWQLEWTPASAGEFRLVVRATDGRGALQTADRTAPAPKGSTGLHRVTLSVSV